MKKHKLRNSAGSLGRPPGHVGAGAPSYESWLRGAAPRCGETPCRPVMLDTRLDTRYLLSKYQLLLESMQHFKLVFFVHYFNLTPTTMITTS